MLACSYLQCADAVGVRLFANERTMVICLIETPEGIENIDAIMQVSYGIMIAGCDPSL